MRFSRALFAGVVVSLSLLACDLVVGLDKFNKCDVCPSDAAEAGTADVIDDAPSDAFQLPDGVSEASSWARWRMENTPVEVQSGASDASLAQFTTVAGGFHDGVNNQLTWSASFGSAPTIEAATAFCNGLTPTGWRVPTRIELVTLLDSTRKTGVYITPTFDGLRDAGVPLKVWTSSYVRPITTPLLTFWFVDFTSGDLVRSIPIVGGVMCVR